MRIITGDECGLLKETIPELSRPKQQKERLASTQVQPSTQDGVRRVDPNEDQRRSRGVVDMTFTRSTTSSSSSSSSPQSAFAALRANGSVQLWEERHASKETFGTYQCTGVVHNVFDDRYDDSSREHDASKPQQHRRGRPIALDAFADTNRLCAADSLGRISVLSTAAPTPSIVASYAPFAKRANQHLSYTKGSYQNTNIATAMAVDNRGGRVAIAGRERETVLLDIETGDVAWKAKNLPPDPQTLLQHPIWSTALLFLNCSSTTTTYGGSNHVMATGTAFKQVRLYDVRTDSETRRPVACTPDGVLSHRVTALCQVDDHQLVVGDAAGYLHALDMRTLGRRQQGKKLNLARFVGPAGSIRQLVKHDTLPIIATVGLDRMLRTYNVTTRKQMDCVYLKQRLNCLLFCQDDTWLHEQEENGTNAIPDELDGDWEADDEVQDYVDSDDSDDSEDEDGEGSDADSTSIDSDDSLEDDDDGNGDESEESHEEFDDAGPLQARSDDDSPPQRHISKKRRM